VQQISQRLELPKNLDQVRDLIHYALNLMFYIKTCFHGRSLKSRNGISVEKTSIKGKFRITVNMSPLSSHECMNRRFNGLFSCSESEFRYLIIGLVAVEEVASLNLTRCIYFGIKTLYQNSKSSMLYELTFFKGQYRTFTFKQRKIMPQTLMEK
jgi:hypothetical protein